MLVNRQQRRAANRQKTKVGREDGVMISARDGKPILLMGIDINTVLQAKAWHEAGHALMWHVIHHTPDYVCVSQDETGMQHPDGSHVGGYVWPPKEVTDRQALDIRKHVPSINFARSQARGFWAGAIAEENFYAFERGIERDDIQAAIMEGASDDILGIRRIIRAAVGDTGGLEVTNKLVSEEFKWTCIWMDEHHRYLKPLATALWERKKLVTDDIVSILGRIKPNLERKYVPFQVTEVMLPPAWVVKAIHDGEMALPLRTHATVSVMDT